MTYSLNHVYLVLDNHPVHRAFGVRTAYDGFKTLFLPAYSSHLSGVESLWSVFKQEFSKVINRIPLELTKQSFKAEVEKLCRKIQRERDGRVYFMAAREDLSKALQ